MGMVGFTERLVAKAAVLMLVSVLAFLLDGSMVFATPTPPYLIVNHATGECTESILGDDCSWCDPPTGWDVVGYASGNSCPEGYAWVERIDMQCRRYANPFCCTAGGAHRGDCENMVVHDGDGLCAFVDDALNCALPRGWTARFSDVDPARWACPTGYRWVDPLACGSRGLEPDAPLRSSTVLAVGCLLAGFLAVVTVGVVLVFVLVRRRSK